MSKVLNFKDYIRKGFGLFLAVSLCIFILYPYILALVLSLAVRFQTDNSVPSYNICIAMEVLSMALTAFIMGLIVSWFWKTKEVMGSLVASILFGAYDVGVDVYSVILAMALPDAEIMRLFNTRLILSFFGELVMLFMFSFCAAKLMQRIRHLKTEKEI